MSDRSYHPLEQGHFSHICVLGDQVEMKIGEDHVRFNMQTALDVVDILTGYVQDYQQRMTLPFEEVKDHVAFTTLADIKAAMNKRGDE